MDLLTLAAAVVPALLLVRYFARRDVFPEPRHLIVKTFLWGIAIVVPLLLVAPILADLLVGVGDPYLAGLGMAFVTAALPEEGLKLAVVAGYCARKPDFDEPMDGIVYGATASLGFAAFENYLYVADGGLLVAIVRALTAVPAHACFGALMGDYVARARFATKDAGRSPVAMAFLVPLLWHGLYDVPPMVLHALQATGQAVSVGAVVVQLALVLLVLGLLVRQTLRLVRARRRDQLVQLAESKR